MKKERCIICGKSINDGIIIYRRRICKCCEQRLINIDCHSDFYKYYISCIKKNLVPVIMREEELKCQNYHF